MVEQKKLKYLLIIYDGLVNQILKYQSTIWQIPIALFALNALVLTHYKCVLSILYLIIINSIVTYIFRRFTVHQSYLIYKTRLISKTIIDDYPDCKSFIPILEDEKLKPSNLVIIFLVLLIISFVIYMIYLFIN